MKERRSMLNETILDKPCFSEPSVQNFNAITKNSLNKLGISAFEFARVFDDGTAVVLYSDPKIATYVISNEIHISAHLDPSFVKSQFWYISSETGPYLKLMKDIAEIARVAAFADYFERFPGYFDMFCFWVNDPKYGFSLFMNQKENLEKFSHEFREQGSLLIKEVSKKPFRLSEPMKPNFKGLGKKETTLGLDLNLHFDQIHRAILRMKQNTKFKLSSREIDCIRYLTLGKTSRDIGLKLNLSYRTIEHCLESVKNKLACEKKSEIVEKLIQLAS